MGRKLATGAETGVVNELTTGVAGGGTFESSTTRARSGSRSWHASVNNSLAFGQITFSALDITARFSLFVPSAGWSADQAIRVWRRADNLTTEISSLFVRKTGAVWDAFLRIQDGGGQNDSPAVTIAVDEWVDLVVQLDANTGAGQNDTLSLRMRSPSMVETTTSVTANRVSLTPERFEFGIVAGATALAEVFIDDVVIDDALLSVQDQRKFLYAALAFFAPTAVDTDNANWTNDGGAANKQTALTDESDATRIQHVGTAADRIRFTHGGIDDVPSSAGSIVAVYLSSRDDKRENVGDTNGIYRLSMRKGAAGTEVDGPNITVDALGTITTRMDAFVRTTDPDAAAWTEANVDSLRIGVQNQSALATDTVRVEEVWGYAEVILAVSKTDAITETRSLGIKGRLDRVDAITESRSVAIRGKLGVSDAFTAAEAAPAIRGKLGFAETLSAAHSFGIRAKLNFAQAFTAAPSHAIRGRVALTDPLTLLDSFGIRAKLNVEDAWSVVQALGILQLDRTIVPPGSFPLFYQEIELVVSDEVQDVVTEETAMDVRELDELSEGQDDAFALEPEGESGD